MNDALLEVARQIERTFREIREGTAMTRDEWLASGDPVAMLRGPLDVPGDQIPTRRFGDRKLRLIGCASCRLIWRLLTDERSRQAVEATETHADGLASQRDMDRAWAGAMMVESSVAPDHLVATRLVSIGGDHELSSRTQRIIERCLGAGAKGAELAALIREIVGDPFFLISRQWGQSPLKTGVPKAIISDAWLTPTVLSLAQAAYDERGRECDNCGGHGFIYDDAPPCVPCGGTGRTDGGTLDPFRLALVADALEEAGCPDGPLLRHLRGQEACPACGGTCVDALGYVCPRCDDGGTDCDSTVPLPGPHVRGCFAIDLLLGKK